MRGQTEIGGRGREKREREKKNVDRGRNGERGGKRCRERQTETGVEVFVFHWDCTRLGAGDEQQRARSFVHAEGQKLPFFSRICFKQLPNRLVPCHKTLCTASNEKPSARR